MYLILPHFFITVEVWYLFFDFSLFSDFSSQNQKCSRKTWILVIFFIVRGGGIKKKFPRVKIFTKTNRGEGGQNSLNSKISPNTDLVIYFYFWLKTEKVFDLSKYPRIAQVASEWQGIVCFRFYDNFSLIDSRL